MKILNENFKFKELSMGMSSDFLCATEFNSTYKAFQKFNKKQSKNRFHKKNVSIRCSLLCFKYKLRE